MSNRTSTHPLNISYLVVGLIFLGLAGSWALRESGAIDLAEVQWLLPLTLVAAGVIGLIAFAAKGLTGRGQTTEDDSYYEQTDYEGDHP